MKFLSNLFNRKNKYHWYSCKFLYKTKTGTSICDFTSQVGFKNQNDILNARTVKQTFGSLTRVDSIRPYLCNGTLTVEQGAYLGFIENEQ